MLKGQRTRGSRGYVDKHVYGGLLPFYNVSTTPALAPTAVATVHGPAGVTATLSNAFVTPNTITTNSNNRYPGHVPAVLLHKEVYSVTVDSSLRLKYIPLATFLHHVTRVSQALCSSTVTKANSQPILICLLNFHPCFFLLVL